MSHSSLAKKLRRRLRGPLIRWLVKGVAHLSLPANQRLGAWLGRRMYAHASITRRVTETNLRLCFPDKSAAERDALCRQAFIETGKAMTEAAALWLWPVEKIMPLVEVAEGEAELRQAYAAGKGVIVLGPHAGSWEALGIYLAKHFPITSMYRPPNIAVLDPLMRQGRQRDGATLVPTDVQGVRAQIKALKNGELIGLLPDQDPGKSGGVFAPFFGIPANTTTLLPKIAAKTGSPVFTAYAERLPAGQGFRLYFFRASETLSSQDELQATTAMNAEVEKVALALPAQYQWTYRRFNTRPAGEDRIY